MITADERNQLVEYIEARKCIDARRGDACVDRQGKGDLIGYRHPGCFEAERMIEIAQRAG